ncbi:MAG: hypothetical protein LBQ42_14665, partial [Synergistaceae bacterium]|nr:hypothetical protein [Synergistaceae bacterium]
MSNGRCNRYRGMKALFLFAAILAGSACAWASVDSETKPKITALPVNPRYLEYWEKIEAGERPGG